MGRLVGELEAYMPIVSIYRKEHGVEIAEVMIDGGDGCGYAGVVIKDGEFLCCCRL